MSETETNSIDASVVPPAIETSSESTESNATESSSESSESVARESSLAPVSNKPAGYAPVDVKTASPEQIQERLDYLYGQVKPTQRENREMRNIMAEQSRLISELSEGQRAVVNHLTERSFSDNETQLKDMMAQAWQKGDNRAYIDAQARLNQLYTQQEVAKQQPKQQPQQQNQRPANAMEVADRAVQNGEINSEEYRSTEQWQNERDDTGNLLRPWAFGNDPAHQAALYESRSVLANPRFSHLTYEQKLQEIDRRMGVQKKTVQQSVIGGSLTRPAKNAKLELTPKQREIALKLKPKDRSESDQLEWYRKQVEQVKRRAK